MKNCEPPELGAPVFAMLRVPGKFESSAAYSSAPTHAGAGTHTG